VVLDTEKRPRKSWVVWREQGKYPDVIVEILSDSTANIDRNNKKILYQNTFRTPNYGQLVPTPQEAELQQRQAKEQAILEKEQALLEKERERQAKEKLAQKLRELGIDPDTI